MTFYSHKARIKKICGTFGTKMFPFFLYFGNKKVLNSLRIAKKFMVTFDFLLFFPLLLQSHFHFLKKSEKSFLEISKLDIFKNVQKKIFQQKVFGVFFKDFYVYSINFLVIYYNSTMRVLQWIRNTFFYSSVISYHNSGLIPSIYRLDLQKLNETLSMNYNETPMYKYMNRYK